MADRDALRDEESGTDPAILTDLPHVLERAKSQILEVLDHLRECRVALKRSTAGNLQLTHERLRAATMATEDAAINIMDACDRATGLVDELDAIDVQPQPDRARAGDLRSALRDELSLMMSALQFQDITSQQLAHASAVLVEMEEHLDSVARLFGAGGLPLEHRVEELVSSVGGATFDPRATTLDAERRQALADEIFMPVKASIA